MLLLTPEKRGSLPPMIFFLRFLLTSDDYTYYCLHEYIVAVFTQAALLQHNKSGYPLTADMQLPPVWCYPEELGFPTPPHGLDAPQIQDNQNSYTWTAPSPPPGLDAPDWNWWPPPALDWNWWPPAHSVYSTWTPTTIRGWSRARSRKPKAGEARARSTPKAVEARAPSRKPKVVKARSPCRKPKAVEAPAPSRKPKAVEARAPSRAPSRSRKPKAADERTSQKQPTNVRAQRTSQKQPAPAPASQKQPEATEEDWARRLEHRHAGVSYVKSTEEYAAFDAARADGRLDASITSVPRTPNAENREVSKRKWEESIQLWRSALRPWAPLVNL